MSILPAILITILKVRFTDSVNPKSSHVHSKLVHSILFFAMELSPVDAVMSTLSVHLTLYRTFQFVLSYLRPQPNEQSLFGKHLKFYL